MDVKHQIAPLATLGSLKTEALLLVLSGDDFAQGLDPALGALAKGLVQSGDFEVKPGRSLVLHRPTGVAAARLVFVAAASSGTPKALRAAVVAGLKALKPLGARLAHVAVSAGSRKTGALEGSVGQALATAAAEVAYTYRHTKPSAPAPSRLDRVTLCCEASEAKAVAAGVARGAAIAAGITLAREQANRPGNHATPRHLGEVARKLGRDHDLKVEVLDRKGIEKLGMGAFLAVAQGSEEPPRFIVLRYHGAGGTEPPVVLVGKGITFDTGGISIKPAGEMDEMKFDMSGAASVLGTMRAVAQLKPRVNVVGVIAACENMPDGRAVKPGDVVTTMSGQTVEILNTDAEGRLILCDALTYVERFKPAAVVDIATLTGACVIALGHQHSGLFCTDDALAEQLLAAGDAALDTCWRMPLDEEYGEALKSHFADMGNVGGRAGGAITAACFLRKFTGKYPWAHLDIAGTAWKSGADKGATGRPVGLLTEFVLARAAQEPPRKTAAARPAAKRR
jgi:leucyl aminopeptidase